MSVGIKEKRFSKQVRSFLQKMFCTLFGGRGVHYINGPETLPPPLSRKEEELIFLRLSEHDEEAKQQLIVHNLRLVVYIAKKFESTGINVEDLISIGTIGLIKATPFHRKRTSSWRPMLPAASKTKF